ncbi:MAG: site-specific DNA-methyltransferase [Synergistaceae bacterium]|nr:site-specific DNA-methyltransferase [Synergistaceae bacterium]
MSAIDELISRIKDENLRANIQREVLKLSARKKFGLVFEEHLPECTPLYDRPLKPGAKAALRNGKITKIYTVLKISGNTALCLPHDDDEPVEIAASDLVCVAEFGEAIYPYLREIDSVCNDPENDLWHVLIEAENYHALQLLEYICAGKVDCIYIDPPYNTGARDWKYNNDYVDGNDAYRHSKWLSFMSKRLRLARNLLKQDGALIVTIDDNELSRLTLLLEEIFPERRLFDVHIQHNPRGTQGDFFAVTHETAIFAVTKSSKIYRRIHDADDEDISNFRKWGNQSARSNEERAATFYPVIVDQKTLSITGFGEVLKLSEHPQASNVYHGDSVYVYPIDKNQTERKWRYSRENAEDIKPFLKAVRNRSGVIEIFIARMTENTKTIWTDDIYNAEIHGTKLVHKILGRNFPFPKSLYAVHNCLWHVVADKPDALILDFFAGSGTTLHAVNLLNAEDSGHRRCIMVTNNEVSEAEARTLTEKGFSPGTPEWDSLGIARYVTWPRTVCAITGHDINGNPLKGSYTGSDIPMSDGFKANAVFFSLGFLDKDSVALGRKFREILPLLWLKSGAFGKCPAIDDGELPAMLILPENKFAVLNDESLFMEFEEAVNSCREIQTVFIVTDYDSGFRAMARSIHAERKYQLYRDYLDNFRINHQRS